MLQVKNLTIEIRENNQWYKAVDTLNFSVKPGEILGLIGESGSGKSITAKAITGTLPQTARIGAGDIVFDNDSICSFDYKRWRQYYGKKISFIMQNTTENLNPLMKIGKQLIDAYLVHHNESKKQAKMRALEVLERVGITDSIWVYGSYPHQLSGGMKQRVMIAIAVINRPQLIVADEPTTALDATVRKQVLDLLDRLRNELHIGVIFISHDINAVNYIADSTFVLYGGISLEYGETKTVLNNPNHPYTEALLKAVPTALEKKKLEGIPGNVPSIYDDKQGCIFYERCSYSKKKCLNKFPDFIKGSDRRCACHFPLDRSNTKEEGMVVR